jgi:putative transposase
MQRKESFVEGELYHLYNRGNSKQNIFLDDNDRNRFVKMLYLSNSKKRISFREDIVRRKIDAWEFNRGKPIVSIGAWVLMPNHFHLLVTIPKKSSPTSDVGSVGKRREVGKNEISLFMKKVFTSYSKYFNTKYKRTGGLFETNFKCSYIDSDPYAKYIFSYIHLNPIKIIYPKWKENGIKDIAKAKAFLDKYEWSSYHDYCGNKRNQNKIISKNDFPEYFDNAKVFKDEIFDWLEFKNQLPTSDVGNRVGG